MLVWAVRILLTRRSRDLLESLILIPRTSAWWRTGGVGVYQYSSCMCTCRHIAWSIITKAVLIAVSSDAVAMIEVLSMIEYQLVKGESSHCIGSCHSFVYHSKLSALYRSKCRTVVPLLLIGVPNPRNAGWKASCWVVIVGRASSDLFLFFYFSLWPALPLAIDCLSIKHWSRFSNWCCSPCGWCVVSGVANPRNARRSSFFFSYWRNANWLSIACCFTYTFSSLSDTVEQDEKLCSFSSLIDWSSQSAKRQVKYFLLSIDCR